jgi:hypothetical protein
MFPLSMTWELAIQLIAFGTLNLKKGLGLPLRDLTPKFNTPGFDTLMI